jgi:hypothetical protein
MFKGIRNDENQKQIPIDYFFKIKNWNYPATGVLGLDMILMPERKLQFDNANIDGEFEFRYLDQSEILHTEYIVVNNKKIWKWDLATTKTQIGSFANSGKVSFAVFSDKLYITNGIDNIKVYDGNKGIVSEMGAPIAVDSGSVGLLNVGAYYYAITYVTAGGEEVLGSVSNIVTLTFAHKIDLTFSLGYSGTLTRNIYRTTAGSSTLYYLDSIPNNTTTTYQDNIADASLGAQIPATNNELPKPYFLRVAGQKLFGIKISKYPTQVAVTGVNNDVFDLGENIDASNYADDNTPLMGGGVDFDRLLVGSGKNIFIINPSDNTVIPTRANVGIKDGYSVQSLPTFGAFQNGLMFVSTKNDVRVMRGELGSIPTTLSNLGTENWAQQIRGDIENALKSYSNICSEFHNYIYLLQIDSVRYAFDIRTQGWTEHEIKTTNYQSIPKVMAVLNKDLYNGQSDGWIEKEYTSVQYRNEDVEAFLQSPYIGVDRLYKYIEGILLWFIPTVYNKMTVNVITDDNTEFSTQQTFSVLAHSNFEVLGGAFDSTYFSKNYFQTDLRGMDYRKVNINQNCRWFQWALSVTVGNISLQGTTYLGQPLTNKEGDN